MTPIATISFALAMLVLAASPGPGVMATVARALTSGLRPALLLIGGIILGDLIFLLFAIFGLSFLAQALGQFFVVIKILGGGYLIWQGLKIFFDNDGSGKFRCTDSKSGYGSFISGFLITLGNPKVILFYCGFLPTFLSLTALTYIDTLMIMGVISIVLFAVLGCYAWLASSARHLLQEPGKRKILNRAAGSVLITTGIVIANRS
ncbi:MAG: LysE family translocator [Deltaproteobacteria bacterium]|jgi:threonine/homoserine/homoserine lactone efflux protein|nr:LysE family translocator [Deltaproteobacteria bacterium]